MDYTDVLSVIGAFGGVTAISGGVAAVVGKIMMSRLIQSHKAELDKQLENHKNVLTQASDLNRLMLKRQELMFEREYTAVSDFLRLFSEITPDPWAPDLDWSDAQVRIAENLFDTEKRLKSFLNMHSASLSEEVRRLINSAKTSANQGSFEVAQDTDEGDYLLGSLPSDRVRKLVDSLVEDLTRAESRLRIDLENGSFSSRSSAKLPASSGVIGD